MFTASLLLLTAYLLKNKTIWVNPAKGIVSSHYGNRYDGFHNGTDIYIQVGTPVSAAAAGVVTDASYNSMNGNYVTLVHKIGKDEFQTIYLHLSALKVKVGQKVSKGQLIGLSGNTGYSTGPHLHFMVLKNGTILDPVKTGFFTLTQTNSGLYFS